MSAQPLPPAYGAGRLWLLGAAAAVGALAVGGALWWSGVFDPRSTGTNEEPPAPPVVVQADFPLPPLSSSPFRNTGAEARYVGSESCRSCHQRRTESFRQTGMGSSTAEVDPAKEPPDAVFDHPRSKSRFQITRKDGKLWHRELLLTTGSADVVLAEYPLKYVVGSGIHARTYLVEADGFLMESPVTWYRAR